MWLDDAWAPFMHKLLVAMLIASIACPLWGVERAGVEVKMPQGWRAAAGTCTGDVIYSYPSGEKRTSVSLIVGARKYRDRDAEYISTGEWVDFYRFEDVLSQLARMYGDELAWLAVRSVELERFGKALLCSLEFTDSGSGQGRARLLVVEVPQHGGVLLIQCSFEPAHEQLANETFESCVISTVGECPQLKAARADKPNEQALKQE